MEPKRQSDIDLLVPYVADRVRRILAAMQKRGFDPVVFESLRTPERQKWLYSIGRTRQKNRKPVTYLDGVKSKGMHQRGKAVDIISKKKLWGAPPAFWSALKQEALKEQMHTLKFELCHIEFRG